jgi:hypothetical protein
MGLGGKWKVCTQLVVYLQEISVSMCFLNYYVNVYVPSIMVFPVYTIYIYLLLFSIILFICGESI